MWIIKITPLFRMAEVVSPYTKEKAIDIKTIKDIMSGKLKLKERKTYTLEQADPDAPTFRQPEFDPDFPVQPHIMRGS